MTEINLNEKITQIGGEYDLTENDKKDIIRAYITLLHEDIISAYECGT